MSSADTPGTRQDLRGHLIEDRGLPKVELIHVGRRGPPTTLGDVQDALEGLTIGPVAATQKTASGGQKGLLPGPGPPPGPPEPPPLRKLHGSRYVMLRDNGPRGPEAPRGCIYGNNVRGHGGIRPDPN